MKGFRICIFIFAATSVSGANTYAEPGVGQSCSSSANLVLTITNSEKYLSGVRVDIYHEVENGERLVWEGITASNGKAVPSELSKGQYRVFANAGDYIGQMNLVVGDFEGITKCNLKIALPHDSDTLGRMPEQPGEVRLKDFHVVVVDGEGVPIPHAIVRILENESAKDMGRFQSDGNGVFGFHLEAGLYYALFSYQGYKDQWLVVQIGNGWHGSKVTLIPANSSRHNPPATEWMMQQHGLEAK